MQDALTTQKGFDKNFTVFTTDKEKKLFLYVEK